MNYVITSLLFSSIIGLGLQSNTVEYHAPISPVDATEWLRSKVNAKEVEYSLQSSLLANLVESESNWNPEADNGHDRGLVQINRKSNPEITDEQAFDVDFALNWAAQKLSTGESWRWVSCSCVSFIRAMGIKIPRVINAGDLDINSLVPLKHGIVKLFYNHLYHLAYIESVEEDGIYIREANYEPCKIGRRILSPTDKHIIGYYSPTS